MKIKSSIKNKILILLGTMFFLFVINNLWAIVNLRKLDNSINAIMKSNYNSIVAVQDMSLILERQDSLQLSYIFTKNVFSIFIVSFQINTFIWIPRRIRRNSWFDNAYQK